MEGGILAIPPLLNNDAVEYQYGTPATVIQMACNVL